MENEVKNLGLTLVTHSGSFHADDIFASATLALLFERDGKNFKIIRSRDLEVIKAANYVYDVGLIHDEATNRFDHHQQGGAGKGKYGMEYSSFGLIWKKYGVDLCGSEKVADIIDKRLVSPVDAGDNGTDLVTNKYEISQYVIQNFFSSMQPTWKEENLNYDEQFMKCVVIAKELLLREIANARDFVLAEESVLKIYNDTTDKRLIVLDDNYPCERILVNFTEPLFIVYPRNDGTWAVKGVPQSSQSFMSRKKLPEAWGALVNEELQKVTGVSDAVFCHRALFLAVAKSKEGALKLAELALQNP